MIGELDAGNPHVQFDEGAQETCDSVTRLCPTLRRPHFKEVFFHRRRLPVPTGTSRNLFTSIQPMISGP